MVKDYFEIPVINHCNGLQVESDLCKIADQQFSEVPTKRRKFTHFRLLYMQNATISGVTLSLGRLMLGQPDLHQRPDTFGSEELKSLVMGDFEKHNFFFLLWHIAARQPPPSAGSPLPGVHQQL